MEDRTLWVTVERPTTAEELTEIQESIEDTPLAEKYEILVTTDGIETMSKQDMRHMIDELKDLYEKS